MRVAVTGHNGFVGRHVVDELHRLGHDVVRPTGRPDLRDPTVATEAAGSCDALIHLAARVGGIGRNRRRPADMAYDNAVMACNVVRACAQSGAHLVALGSVCAYPSETAVPFDESTIWNGYPEATNAPYGIAKRLLLTLCEAYAAQYNLTYCYLLPANMYGIGDNAGRGSHVVPALIRKVLDAQERGDATVTLWGDGTPTRDLLYAEDAASAICRAVECQSTAPINLGTGVETSIASAARMVADAAGYRGSFVYDRSKPNGQMRRMLSTHRAESVLGWRASTPLEIGIERTVEWYRAHRTD